MSQFRLLECRVQRAVRLSLHSEQVSVLVFVEMQSIVDELVEI